MLSGTKSSLNLVLLASQLVLGCGATSSLDDVAATDAGSGCESEFNRLPADVVCEGVNLVPLSMCGPAAIARGVQFTFEFVVKNSGTLATPAGTGDELSGWVGVYLLSADATINKDDLRIGAFTAEPALAPGATWSSSDVAGVPQDMPPGSYYFGMMLDPFQKLAETDETDNVIGYCSALDVR